MIVAGPSRNLRRYSSTSTGNLEESYFLQVSLDSVGDQIALDRRSTLLFLLVITWPTIQFDKSNDGL